MNKQEPWSTYFKGVMQQVPPGTQARDAVNAALDEYETSIRAITKSKANVVALDARIDAAREELVGKLLKLSDTEQPDDGDDQEQTREQPARDVSPLDKLIEERS